MKEQCLQLKHDQYTAADLKKPGSVIIVTSAKGWICHTSLILNMSLFNLAEGSEVPNAS